MTKRKENCRETTFTPESIKSHHFYSQSVLGKTLLTLLPALVCGCTAEDISDSAAHAEKSVCLKINGNNFDISMKSIDIFVFRDDGLRQLDCYQRVDEPDIWNREITSGTGERVINIFANSQMEKDEWPWIRTQESLKRLTASLELEQREAPFMSGETAESISGSGKAYADIDIRPLVSEIYLRSLSCDFTGKPYAGEKLTDIRVYLTNINAECGIMDDGTVHPTRLINVGRLDMEDVELFMEPELVFQEVNKPAGKTAIMPEVKLWCYASNAAEDSPGSPYSRLVIEGKVSGETYYWPININRDGNGCGIGRNQRYTYDVKITRKGSDDPDTPVETDDIEINFSIEPWEEKKDCHVSF